MQLRYERTIRGGKISLAITTEDIKLHKKA